MASRLFTMGTVKFVVGFLAIVGVIMACWQIVPPELANYSFQDDLKNLAMVSASQVTRSDEDLRSAVINKAKEHDIPLEPTQVTVQHIGTPGVPAVYFAADYSVPVKLPGYSFDLHFNPTSGNKGF
jgi:hypothetical protein